MRGMPGQILCGALGTEVVCVRPDSVVAVVGRRDDDGQQFTLNARELGGSEHDCLVELHGAVEHPRVVAHRLDDVEDLPRPIDGGLVLLRQCSGRLVLGDETDVRHARILPHGVAKRPRRCSKLLLMLGRSEDEEGVQESVNPLTAASERTKAYTEVGDAVAGVLRAAEEAAEQIRADARTEAAKIVERAHEDAAARIQELTRAAERARADADEYGQDIRTAVDGYASQQRREAEEEARTIVAEAEGQARAIREAAEGMAEQIEGDARRHSEQLRDEARSLEERRQRILDSLREMRAQLNELFPELAPPGRSEAELLDALDVEHRR